MPFDFQSGPKYYNDAIKDIIERSRQLGSQPYIPFRHVSEERRRSVESEIDRLRELQKGNEFDIIPFSITGKSEPININPDDLKNIIQNEEFARSVYESATGNHNVSRDEIEGLRQRAIQKFESSLPDIQRLEAERQPTFRRPKVESELSKLTAETKGNIGKKRALEAELQKLISQRSPLTSHIQKIESRIQGIDSSRSNLPVNLGIPSFPYDPSPALRLKAERQALEKEKQTILSQLDRISSERPKVESELSKLTAATEENVGKKRALEAELQRLSSQRQPSAAAEEEIRPPESPQVDWVKTNSLWERSRRELKNLLSHRDKNDSFYLGRKQKIDAEIPRLEEQIPRLKKEVDLQRALATQKQPRNISPSAESSRPEPQHRHIPYASQSPQDLIRRVGIEREVNKLQGKHGRIAPMNEYDERAINMTERGIDDDSMELAADELRESKKHDELKAVEPYVRASLEGPSDEYMSKYVDDYTKDIRKAIQDESEEEFLKKIAPKINMSFSQMGAFHSGARNKALKDAANEHRLKLHRELAHLTGSARDKGMEHHELQKRREQSAGHLIGHTTKSEKEGAQRQGELLRQHAVTKHGLNQMNAAALSQIGKAKREHEQQETDVEREEFERQRLHHQNQLEKEYAILNGAQVPRENFSGNLTPSPTPPSLLPIGAGLLATAASGFGQQQQRQFKKGGSVHKKYAAGGSIGSDKIGNEIRNIIQEQNQSGKSRLEEASNQNPIQGWLRHVGRELLSNPSEDPLLSLGRGTANAMDHRDVMRERSANLYDKIQATKLNQYQVLAAYENMKDQRAFQREQLGETRRGHDIMREISLRKQNSVFKNPKKSSADKKMEDKALENIMENHEMKNDLILIDDAIKKSTLGTGPWVGRGKSFLGIGNEIDVLGNHIVTKANKLYGRGAGSNLQLKTLQGGKPGQNLSKEANETIIKKYGQESDRRINKNVAYLIKSGWTPEEISQATGMEMPKNSLGTEESKINTENRSSENSIFNMIDPDGNPLVVPKNELAYALKLGANFAE